MRLAGRHFRHEDVDSALDARVLLAATRKTTRPTPTPTRPELHSSPAARRWRWWRSCGPTRCRWPAPAALLVLAVANLAMVGG